MGAIVVHERAALAQRAGHGVVEAVDDGRIRGVDPADPRVRAEPRLLAPDQTPTYMPSTNGRHLVIDLYDVRPAEVDRTVTLTTTNTHPAFAVVLFDLWSHPLTRSF